MMSNQSSRAVVILLIVTMTTAVSLMFIQPSPFTSALQVESPYPTDYPPGKQTGEAIERQTDAAYALTPFPTGTLWIFSPSISTLAVPPTSASTLNPNGEIRDDVGEKMGDMYAQNAWYDQD